MGTCCSSGKARIYYNIPTQGGLKYKFKNSTKWNTIIADEPLTHECIPAAGVLINWRCPNSDYIDSFNTSFPAVITDLQGGGGVSSWIIFFAAIDDSSLQGGILSGCDRYGDPPEVWISEISAYKFTVTGSETGTKYLETTVEECPAVQTFPCKFDPAKEQYFDVELMTPQFINKDTGAFAGLYQCLTQTSQTLLGIPSVIIWKDTYLTSLIGLSILQFHIPIRTIVSPKGCPPPKARIECLTTPDGQNNKKCPKETDCQMDCNGMRCCYSKGVLIRSFRL